MDAPPPDLTAPHVSNRVMRPIVEELRLDLGDELLAELISSTGLPPGHLDHSDRWVSVEFIEALCVALAHRRGLTELPPYEHAFWQAWRAAGHRTMSPDGAAPAIAIAKKLLRPSFVYNQLPRLYEQGSAVAKITVEAVSPGRLEVEATVVDPTIPENPAACWNRRGVLEAVPTVFGLPLADVTHTQCPFQGSPPGTSCRYEVRYRDQSLAGARWPLGLMLGGAVTAAGAAALAGGPTAAAALVGAFAGLGVEGWRRHHGVRQAHAGDLELLRAHVQTADRRYRQVWESDHALRTALTANQRIAPYLPRTVLELLGTRDAQPRLGGEERDVSLLFSDIRAYSSWSEGLRPTHVLRILNEYFGEMTAAADMHGGTVLEFIGDGLLVAFGLDEGSDPAAHPQQAVRAALAMQERLISLNADWQQRGEDRVWRDRGTEELGMRIGIHRGQVVAGNIGSEEQMKFTVIGAIVNLAARLEALNKELGTDLLVSAEVHRDLDDALAARFDDLGPQGVKGHQEPIAVWALRRPGPG
jgi:class 3 adenylate cyclase